jgi:hypothetical protein
MILQFLKFPCLNLMYYKTQDQPGPASAVEERRTTKREDPGSTPDEGS